MVVALIVIGLLLWYAIGFVGTVAVMRLDFDVSMQDLICIGFFSILGPVLPIYAYFSLVRDTEYTNPIVFKQYKKRR